MQEDMDKVNSRALTEMSAINAEVQYTIALVKKVYQVQRRPIETPKDEVEILNRGMIEYPCLNKWSEDMDSALTPVLELMGEHMKHLEINNGTVGWGVGIWMYEIAAPEDKWEGQQN